VTVEEDEHLPLNFKFASYNFIQKKTMYVVLPKNSGNLNATRELFVVWPAAARWGEQYPL
jgi:hypothetical protein